MRPILRLHCVVVVDESAILGRERCTLDVRVVVWRSLELLAACEHALQREQHRADVEYRRPFAAQDRSADMAVAVHSDDALNEVVDRVGDGSCGAGVQRNSHSNLKAESQIAAWRRAAAAAYLMRIGGIGHRIRSDSAAFALSGIESSTLQPSDWRRRQALASSTASDLAATTRVSIEPGAAELAVCTRRPLRA
ncbi:hypothetical protein L1887_58630 [Cichorium endivia]|nr:hypothetical protein L1887_58630 [Cichorium endivia]